MILTVRSAGDGSYRADTQMSHRLEKKVSRSSLSSWPSESRLLDGNRWSGVKRRINQTAVHEWRQVDGIIMRFQSGRREREWESGENQTSPITKFQSFHFSIFFFFTPELAVKSDGIRQHLELQPATKLVRNFFFFFFFVPRNGIC